MIPAFARTGLIAFFRHAKLRQRQPGVGRVSDALCTIATGASYTKRQLHTDSDEIILTVVRPVLITSVSEVVTRTDLASRAVIVNLAVIEDNKRMTEREFNAALEKARPRILGALLDAASHGRVNLLMRGPSLGLKLCHWSSPS